VVLAFLDRGLTVPAVQTGTLGDCFELAKEMALRVTVLVYEYPATMLRFRFAIFEQFEKLCR